MLPSCPELGLRREIRGFGVCLVSNRFRKYCLGLSTSSSDQRGLSRDTHQHELMAAGGSCVCVWFICTRVHMSMRLHVFACVHAHVCSSSSSGTGL